MMNEAVPRWRYASDSDITLQRTGSTPAPRRRGARGGGSWRWPARSRAAFPGQPSRDRAGPHHLAAGALAADLANQPFDRLKKEINGRADVVGIVLKPCCHAPPGWGCSEQAGGAGARRAEVLAYTMGRGHFPRYKQSAWVVGPPGAAGTPCWARRARGGARDSAGRLRVRAGSTPGRAPARCAGTGWGADVCGGVVSVVTRRMHYGTWRNRAIDRKLLGNAS